MDLKNKIKIFITLVFLVTSAVQAQNDKPLMSSGDLQFYMDKAVFTGQAEKQFVEFYFMFFTDRINFTRNSRGEIVIRMNINDEYGKKAASKEWTLEVKLAEDETGIKTKVFYDQVTEYLSPGKYKITVSANDINSSKKGELIGEVEIKNIGKNTLSTSEVEFVASVDNNDGPEHFRKGINFIVPNPSRRYGVLNPVLYFYYEIYNIIPAEKRELKVEYTVSSVSSEFKKTYPVVKVNKSNTTSAVTHGLNVGKLPSGIYNLIISVEDIAENQTAGISRIFEVIQMDYVDRKPALEINDSEIFDRILSIVGTSSQLENYRKLSSNGKAAYMIEFWKSMDPSPGTTENEYLNGIQQRFNYALKNFGWGKIEGWKSERGRVLIKYGNPDEIQQHHSEGNSYPYEIWIYQREKRYIFVFGDLSNNGKYVLLHSDREGEISNLRWRDYLRKM